MNEKRRMRWQREKGRCERGPAMVEKGGNRPVMRENEVLVLESPVVVDARAARAVGFLEITTLDHKILNLPSLSAHHH
jgi:hypothetical protein